MCQCSDFEKVAVKMNIRGQSADLLAERCRACGETYTDAKDHLLAEQTAMGEELS